MVMENETEILMANFYLSGVSDDPPPILSIKKDTGEITTTVHGKKWHNLRFLFFRN